MNEEKIIYILNMNNINSNEFILRKQIDYLKSLKDNCLVRFYNNYNKSNIYDLDLVKEYKELLKKNNYNVFYKNEYNNLIKELMNLKLLKEIIISGVNIYDFSFDISNILKTNNKNVNLFVSLDTTNIKEVFNDLNVKLCNSGIKIVQAIDYIEPLEKKYNLIKKL